MHNLDINQQNILKNLLAIAPKHCDNCGSRYNQTDFKIMKSSSASIVFHLKCQVCGNSYVLNVMNPQNGIIGAQRMPFNTDLSSDTEIQAFAGKDAVNRNEAIDLYSKLNDKFTKKDLEKFFQQKR